MSVLLAVDNFLCDALATAFAQERPAIHVAGRCADEAELLASAQAGLGAVALVNDADMSLVYDLHRYGVKVVAVNAAPNAIERGCDAVCSPFVPEIVQTVQRFLAVPERQETNLAGKHGRVIAVWGTGGSPGRSVLARDLAAEFAYRKNRSISEAHKKKQLSTQGQHDVWNQETLLIDGDTYNPSLSQLLCLNHESSAIVAASRHINTGDKHEGMLAELVVPVAGFSFLAGLNTGTRWREITVPVARELFTQARREWGRTIVDCASQAERREFGYDAERDGFVLELLEAADDVVIVAKTTPVGVRRLLEKLDEAREHGVEEPHIALTHVGSVRRNPEDKKVISDILLSRGYENMTWIRYDNDKYAEAERKGCVLREIAPHCGVVRDVSQLAARLARAQ